MYIQNNRIMLYYFMEISRKSRKYKDGGKNGRND